MKQMKRPTVRQKEFIRGYKLNPDNWYVERDTPREMVLIHKETGRSRTIQKGA